VKGHYEVSGRTVFITGAARGIGAETARRLHAKGANVALVGLEPERLERLAAELGDRAAAFHADVSDFDALRHAVDGCVRLFGAIDVGIANAGIAFSGASLATAPVEQVERVFAVNLLGAWRTDRALIGHIVERKGYLLNITSLAAVIRLPAMNSYSAAKAGVEALADTLRTEIEPTGARVGCAYFGPVDTDLMRSGLAQPSARAVQSEVPAFTRRTLPVAKAVDAIERGIERRSARIWPGHGIGVALALRGLLQPLVEWRMSASRDLIQAGFAAAEAAGEADAQDPLLGMAVQATPGLDDHPQPTGNA
jgi:NAD(P)-dependent dehydrogenase (short-subunit alcohol dehydrogenase family)